MENSCRTVVGTVEWVNNSWTKDVVQVDMSQLCRVDVMCACVGYMQMGGISHCLQYHSGFKAHIHWFT